SPEPEPQEASVAAVATVAASPQRPNPEPRTPIPDPTESRLRIIPPPGDIVTGVQKVETLIGGNAIKAVEFSLDGRKIAVRRAPPFTLDFDFGIIPQMRRIRAVGLDAADKPLTGNDIVINIGTDPFRV